MRVTQQRTMGKLVSIALLLSITGFGCIGLGEDATGEQYFPDGPYDYSSGSEAIDRHDDHGENLFIETDQENTSTFSVDVNTASYTIMRRDLLDDRLPVPESVRVEEFINFFRFEYPEPSEEVFSINMEVAPSYFGSFDEVDRHLLRIGIRGREIAIEEMKPTNLVFLIDVSGSMQSPARLPLVKQALQTLLDHLRPSDTVGIQTYASGSEAVLQPTPVSNRSVIEAAIDSLSAGGSTFGEGGIIGAYDMAEEAFIDGGNNRVVIFTDGDFNVGKRGDELVELVQDYREREIALTSVGFGLGGYNDSTMERLAREGNGNYFYIDSMQEAKRIFGSELPSTVEVIAADMKVQVEFDVDAVKRYRLVGYEKRILDNEDFADDSVDAAEVGPGHTVTAFYELELAAGEEIDPAFLAEVRVRHKEYFDQDSVELSWLIKMNEIHDEFSEATPGFRFAASVAEFAQVLRGSQFVQGARFDEIHDIAEAAAYEDYSEQQEFLQLVTIASDLWEE